MNGIVKFELEGVKYSLLFGMKANRIFIEKYAIELAKLNENTKEGEEIKVIDDIKSVAFVIYAGLCNYAESMDEQYPSYHESYMITEKILSHEDESIQNNIWRAFIEAKANSKIIRAAGLNSESKEEKKKK